MSRQGRDNTTTVIAVLLAAGGVYSFLGWVLARASDAGGLSPLSVRGLGAVACLIALSLLAERLAPAAGISYVDWIYRYRPDAKVPPRFRRLLPESVLLGLAGAVLGHLSAVPRPWSRSSPSRSFCAWRCLRQGHGVFPPCCVPKGSICCPNRP